MSFFLISLDQTCRNRNLVENPERERLLEKQEIIALTTDIAFAIIALLGATLVLLQAQGCIQLGCLTSIGNGISALLSAYSLFIFAGGIFLLNGFAYIKKQSARIHLLRAREEEIRSLEAQLRQARETQTQLFLNEQPEGQVEENTHPGAEVLLLDDGSVPANVPNEASAHLLSCIRQFESEPSTSQQVPGLLTTPQQNQDVQTSDESQYLLSSSDFCPTNQTHQMPLLKEEFVENIKNLPDNERAQYLQKLTECIVKFDLIWKSNIKNDADINILLEVVSSDYLDPIKNCSGIEKKIRVKEIIKHLQKILLLVSSNESNFENYQKVRVECASRFFLRKEDYEIEIDYDEFNVNFLNDADPALVNEIRLDINADPKIKDFFFFPFANNEALIAFISTLLTEIRELKSKINQEFQNNHFSEPDQENRIFLFERKCYIFKKILTFLLRKETMRNLYFNYN